MKRRNLIKSLLLAPVVAAVSTDLLFSQPHPVWEEDDEVKMTLGVDISDSHSKTVGTVWIGEDKFNVPAPIPSGCGIIVYGSKRQWQIKNHSTGEILSKGSF